MVSEYISKTWWLHVKNQSKNFVKPYMKNFQVKHGQCDSIIFHKTYSFDSSEDLLDLCFADSKILYFWQVLESTHKFIIEFHVL